MAEKIALDIATTMGIDPNPRRDRILAVAVVGNPAVDMAVLIDPGGPVPPEATMATGIDDITAGGGMDYRKGLELVARSLTAAWESGFVVAGYEISNYLLPVLFHQQSAVYGRRLIRPGPIMDVKSVFRKQHPKMETSLPSIASYLGVHLGNGADVQSRAAAVLEISRVLDTPR